MRNLESTPRNLGHASQLRNPKVLILITKGEIGGAQTHVLSLCKALVDQVNFIAAIGGTEPQTPLGKGLETLHIPVIRLPKLGNSMSPLRLVAAVRELMHLLRQQRPDVIHAHSAAAGVVARIAGIFTKIPIVYTVHGFGFKPEVSPLRRRVVWLAEFVLARFTGHIICVSENERQLAHSLPLKAERISVLHNALPDTNERAQLDHASVSVIMVARFASPKRPDLLLNALALVRDRLGYEVPTSLVGSGPNLDASRRLARQLNLQMVTFTGDVDDVPQRLAKHAIFVLMSDHEGLPISIIEAMRAGLAIIASDVPGMRELILPDESGLLVANHELALADAIAKLLSLKSLRAYLGQAARTRYEDRFKAERRSNPVAAIYKKLAHATGTPAHPTARS
jgi:glycosyltransferase involved in cell wall biosynthesis